MARLIFIMLWLGFIAYAFIFAPPDQPETFDLIQRMSVGDWEGINPLIIAVFNAMGIWPMVYACVVLIDGQGQRVMAWPFVTASFAVGAFALLPYLAWRRPNSVFVGPKTVLLRLVDARWLGFSLLMGAIAVLSFGLLNGDGADFWQQWQTSRFIHVMTLDFCMLWLLFPTLLPDDMARRNWQQPWVYPMVLALPLVGACLYLTLRPRLTEASPTSAEAKAQTVQVS
jgi:hypothetical protein